MPEPAVPPRLLATRRHNEILRRTEESGAVGVGELAVQLGVSRETIRRDLKFLAGRGSLAIVHGGAARPQPREPALADRLSENAAGKQAIGQRAATLVRDGMVLMLDCGTTTLAVAQALTGRRGLTVCTTGLAIAQLLCHAAGARVHLLGGDVDPAEEATGGIDVLEAIRRFRVDIAFLGGGGLSPDGEVTDYTRGSAEQRSRMIAAASDAWFVLDQTKFSRLTPVRITGFSAARGLIVDAPLPAVAAAALAERGMTVLQANM